MFKINLSDHKIDYVIQGLEVLNLKGNQNGIIGSKVTAILLEVWILSVGGVASEKACACSLGSRFVSYDTMNSCLQENITQFYKLVPNAGTHTVLW